MATDLMERKKVGRKKKAVPSDYVAVKIPRDVYVNAKMVATFTGEEMAQIIGDACRATILRRADEAYKASRATDGQASEEPKPKRSKG